MLVYDIINNQVEQWFECGVDGLKMIDKIALLENGCIYLKLEFIGYEPIFKKFPNSMISDKNIHAIVRDYGSIENYTKQALLNKLTKMEEK